MDFNRVSHDVKEHLEEASLFCGGWFTCTCFSWDQTKRQALLMISWGLFHFYTTYKKSATAEGGRGQILSIHVCTRKSQRIPHKRKFKRPGYNCVSLMNVLREVIPCLATDLNVILLSHQGTESRPCVAKGYSVTNEVCTGPMGNGSVTLKLWRPRGGRTVQYGASLFHLLALTPRRNNETCGP